MGRVNNAASAGRIKGIFSKRWKSSSKGGITTAREREKAEQEAFQKGMEEGKKEERGIKGTARRIWKTTKGILQSAAIAAPVAAVAYGGKKAYDYIKAH